jgi:CRP-like cAMP-binding protein/thioredoxin reductase/Fe-S-cluster-containing hydrogenase component 2
VEALSMPGSSFPLVIVGSGPAGLAAAANAQANGLEYVLLERADHLADTIFCYQKRKHVMEEPVQVPQRGALPFAAGSRESILAAWSRFAADLNIRYRQEMTGLERADGGFVVRTASERYQAERVVLAVGTQGNPRLLGVPGEDLPHVSTRLVDPDDFVDRDILVVGAGDSALEVALALCERNRVGLVVRTPEILRAKESLERDILGRQATGQLTVHFSTTVHHVEPAAVELNKPEGSVRVPCDQVILKLGATPPRAALESFGVSFAGSGRDARPVLSQRYESSVPGLFLVGAVTGRDLIKLGINQGFEVVEHILGREVEPADEEVLKRRLPYWRGTVRQRIEDLRDEIPMFAVANEELLREVFLSAEVREYRDGEVILRQNDYSDSFLVVSAGEVDIEVTPPAAPKAGARRVATLKAGNFFGEMSLISGRRRNATGIARGGVRLIEIPRKAMLKLMATDAPVRGMVDRSFLIRAFQGYLFPELSESVLWSLVGKARIERLERGKTLFTEGDPGGALYLIRNGQVKISKLSAGRELVLSYLVAGNFFGETALLPDAQRTATVTAIFPTDLIRLDKEDFDRFIAMHPELAAGFAGKLEERRIASLVAEAMPGSSVLSDLIRQEVVMGTQALFIDEHKCVRCGNCISACEGVHADGQARLSLTGIKFYNLLAPNSCWQCENPLCMTDCPPDAIARDPHGEVFIRSNCIGCGNCERNCPYGNIFMVHPKAGGTLFGWLRSIFGGDPDRAAGHAHPPTPPAGAAAADSGDAGRTLAVKCDLCREIHGGPACVRSCPTGAAIRLEPGEYQQRLAELVVRSGDLH